MKKISIYLKTPVVIGCLLFPATQLFAQLPVRKTITITQITELPVKSIPLIGNNGYKYVAGIYPLKISTTDTLFFNRTTERDFVKNGLITAGITSLTRVALRYRQILNYNISYAGRLYNYYYFCNAVNKGYFTVNGLTSKTGATTFSTSYNAVNKLYTVVRNYNNIGYSEAVSNYAPLASSLAADFTNFSGNEYYGFPIANVGSFYFFLTRYVPVQLQTPVITAGGPTTFTAGNSVVLTSSAPTGNTWHVNGMAIAGANGNTYTATTAGTYTVTTTAAGFNATPSNSIVVTVNPVATVVPLMVSGNKLLNHSGLPVILHGVNTASYKSGYANDVAAVSNSIKTNSKVNCVRIMWNSTKFVSDGNIGNPTFFTLPNLDAELQTYTNLHILPILALHDLTDIGDNTVAGFNKYVVAFWTSADVITMLKKYQNNLIINFQNEWGATWIAPPGDANTVFVSTYTSLMVQLRNLGIKCPIMIDAPNGGAESAFMIAHGAALVNADPLHNVILSVHTYWTTENGAIITCSDFATRVKAMSTSNLPFMLGEVSDWAVRGADGAEMQSNSPGHFTCPVANPTNKYAIDYAAILTEACADGIGYMAWSWYQDGNLARNIYDQDFGLQKNIDPHAGSWPTDITAPAKVYSITNPAIVPVW